MEISEFVDSVVTAPLVTRVVAEVITTTFDLPVVSARVLPLWPLTTSEETRAADSVALAGVARPVIPIRATKVVAIARTKTVERLADTITDLFSMRADYENKVSLSLNLDKE
jgi:hypothetical protein